MSTLQTFSPQAIIVPARGLYPRAQPFSLLGSAAILTTLFPQLAISHPTALKPLHWLQPADDFMLQETIELLGQLKYKCLHMGIKDTEFKLFLNGENIKLEGSFTQLDKLTETLQQDKTFVDRLAWLKPNYLALANSHEWLNFAEAYEVSREQARQYFSHLQSDNLGLLCYMRIQAEHIDLVVESPLGLFKVNIA